MSGRARVGYLIDGKPAVFTRAGFEKSFARDLVKELKRRGIRSRIVTKKNGEIAIRIVPPKAEGAG